MNLPDHLKILMFTSTIIIACNEVRLITDKQCLKGINKMPKSIPLERWQEHILERITALRLSGKLKSLRRGGLAVLHRRKLFTNEEWWQSFTQRATSPEYLNWCKECEGLADEFGLAVWVVTMMCLLKGYHPERDIGIMVIERDWPRIRVVTDSTNQMFLKSLSREARKLGLITVQKIHGIENTLVYVDVISDDNESDSDSPPEPLSPGDTFNISVQTPVGFPPEAASKLQREASKLGRELARSLGYRVPKRLRTSKLVCMSKVLEADKRRLPSGALYDIVDKVYPDGDLSKDQQRRKLIASRRHRVRKRLLG